jgi:multidrug efflux system outer membrane protein
MNKKIFLLQVFIVFFLGGCTMTPKYTRPEAPVPSAWPTGSAYHEKKSDVSIPLAAKLLWTEFITDKRLKNIIETALNNNRDLRLAVLNVERARAMYGIGRVSLLPSVNAIGSWYKEHVPADLSLTGSEYTAEQYSVNLGITSWEIDFFGRIRSLKDSALEEYLATDQALFGSQLLLVSTVAQAYLALAADRETLQLVAETLKAQESAYNLIKKRYDFGMISELDLRRAQSQVDSARGDVARYTQLVAQDENALNLLVGSPISPEQFPPDLASVSTPLDISTGLSSETLLHRPDVLAAEHRLKAANANIGAARAAFFPRISLTTSFGTASADLSGLFKSGSDVWIFAPQIVMPIFDARTWFAYDVAKIEKEISITQYEKSIQTAFREVADALAEKGMISQRIEAQQSLVDAFAVTYRLSEARYNKGIDSYLAVLDAQRSLYSAQQGLIMLRLIQSSNLITLYKTLGGGALLKKEVIQTSDQYSKVNFRSDNED